VQLKWNKWYMLSSWINTSIENLQEKKADCRLYCNKLNYLIKLKQELCLLWIKQHKKVQNKWKMWYQPVNVKFIITIFTLLIGIAINTHVLKAKLFYLSGFGILFFSLAF
jgi:hypothetical protein